MHFFSIILATISYVINPADPDLKFDGYKIERHGDDLLVTCAMPRSRLYAEYDLTHGSLSDVSCLESGYSCPRLSEAQKIIRNPAFETRFLNYNPSRQHSLTEYVAASGCNLVQLGRLYGVTMEKTFPEVFAALSNIDKESARKDKRATERSAARQVKELADIGVPAYPILYGSDPMKWNKRLTEAFLSVYPKCRARDPGRSWEKGILCPSRPETKRFIEAFVYEVAMNAPYEGIVATFWDDYGLNCHCGTCRRNGMDKFGNQVAYLVERYQNALKKANKKLILRTWSSGAPHWLDDEWVHAPGYAGKEDALNLWSAAFQKLGPNTMVQTKVYNSDCQPNAPFSELLGEARKIKPDVVEMAEWQVTGQTQGLHWMPAPIVDDIKWRFQKARELIGPKGGVALYAGGFRNPGYDEIDDVINSINLYAWRELSWNPDKDVDEIWREWAAPRYGAVSEKIIPIFKSLATPSVVAFSPLGFGAFTESRLCNNAERREDLYRYTNRQYTEAGQALFAPTKANIDKVVAEKDEAIKTVEQALAALESLSTQCPVVGRDPRGTPPLRECLLRTQWLLDFLYCMRSTDAAMWRYRYLRCLSAHALADRAVLADIHADFDLLRAHHTKLFNCPSDFKFSFYEKPASEYDISLGSPVLLMRDIEEKATKVTERILGP